MSSGLNQRQLEAAVQIHGALLVVAGAGTGKTRVITFRIAQMVRSGVDPQNIVGLSFTNKAAREMRERLTQTLGKRLASRVTLSTFHSYALGLLREHPSAVGLRPGFSIVDENDSYALLSDAIKEARVGEFFSASYFREKISELKDQLCSPEQALRRTGFVDAHIIAGVYAGYEQRLRLYNLVDFDDLVYLAWRLLHENDGLRVAAQKQHTHFLVDEYQDTSNAQFAFLQEVVPPDGNICAVGDDDQSIYGWRGARPGILKMFLESFSNARRVTLDQNYRCSPVILEAANSVIQLNADRLPKQLWSDRKDNEPIRVFRADGEEEEATYVAEQIKRLVSGGVNPGSCAVLYRTSSLARGAAFALASQGLRVRAPAASSLRDRAEVRDVISLLTSAQNPADWRARFRALESLGHDVPLTVQKKISAGEIGLLPEDVDSEWQRIAVSLRSCADEKQVAEFLRIWFDGSPLRERLRSGASSMERALQREDTVERFFGWIDRVPASEGPLLGTALERVVASLSLNRWDSSDPAADAGHVQLLTIHASKGLEFDHVFVIGLEEGILPHERSLESGTEAEERRLMYVAMTRARQALYLTSSATRSSGASASTGSHGVSTSGGRRVATRPSRYLEQIPLNLVEADAVELESPEARRQAAARRLFELFR